ncbi:MAG: hypothetical protein KJ804_11735 [Proteobacteria bacterium]|nr:hypothetical protein [Pseudomonadota bacterium]MBU1058974.1 hypothetical protein [Pseudomonadota bacterium]
MHKNLKKMFVACSVAFFCIAPESGYSKGPYPSGGMHDFAYPPIGAQVSVLPRHHYTGRHAGHIYHYHGGIWYSPAGPGFSIVAPPVGIFVPVLPPDYSTVWVAGIPYYYANDVYYVWNQERNCYMVTGQPQEQANISSTQMEGQLFIYPKNGQDEVQQADDRYECHIWAAEQTGYDPTKPEQNISVQTLKSKRSNYLRAMKACLEGKGYSVR